MDNLIKDLTYDYNYNVFLVKAMLPNLETMGEKSLVSRWLRKLESCSRSVDELRLRNEFLYHLVVSVQARALGQPFTANPPSGPILTFSHLLTTHKRASAAAETVAAALARLEGELARCERALPAARLVVCSAERSSIEQEIQLLEENTTIIPNKEAYTDTFHQMFLSLGLYKRPELGTENEDFVANVNRKEMRRLELGWLRARHVELTRERATLTAELARMRTLYQQLEHLLESVSDALSGRPSDATLERKARAARGARDALATSALRLRAAAEHAHSAVRHLDDALVAWKLAPNAKNAYERTATCADACRLLVAARCGERGARRVLAAPAAPRAARTLRLALDYAFTDVFQRDKYETANDTFNKFKEAVINLINSIHQVLLPHAESLEAAEGTAEAARRELGAVRLNAIAKKGLADLIYRPK